MSDTVPDEAEELLTRKPRIAHLATCRDGRPHAAPLWYNYRAGIAEIATTGRKLTNLRHNPRVALSVQEDDDGSAVWGVILQGTASVVENEAEREAVLRRINRRYGADEDAWEANTPVTIDVATIDYWDYEE
jgi:nitroimidazol reductase NimA-like FMN-containing flavoprotein (pyridoxamine 5'-phosphate oxidase superfamily)